MFPSKRQLPVSAPSEGRFVLHYNSNRPAFTGHTAAIAEKYFRPFVASVMIIVGLCMLKFGAIPLLLYVLLFVIPLTFIDLCRPTNIEVGPLGLRLHWLHPILFITSPWFAWEDVKSVDYVDGAVFGAEICKCFDLTLDISTLDEVQRFVFETLCVSATHAYKKNEITIRLVESGFFQESDQASLRSALKKHLPLARLCPELIAREEFGEVPTYTALWLESLHATVNADLSTLSAGTELAEGRYRVDGLLGAGGQATVYDASYIWTAGGTLISKTEKCVLKEFVLPVRGGMEIKRRAVENIQREAKLLQGLDHPHIVKYRDLFIEGPRAYLVMERIEGMTLRQKVNEDGRMSDERVIDLGFKMCDLLQYMHAQEPPVIHRDFTPENLMVTGNGDLTLIDFNVAHQLESKSTKTVVGKHAYVPPEQFRGKPTTQSDLYSMGGTLFFLLTGKDPEPLTQANPKNRVADVDKQLAAIISRATEPNAKWRYATIGEVKEAFTNLTSTLTLGAQV
jgi:tRNA A-37 threonylcarbamoyl transferase component Bud32